MGIRFCSFASGSTGNCYLVRTEKTNILVDCGISGKRILASLEAIGLSPLDLDGILITHEHTDHVLSVRMMARKAVNAGVYASSGTLAGLEGKLGREEAEVVEGDEDFTVGDISVSCFDLSHDAVEPVGYSFSAGGKRVSIITDTGVITDDIYDHIKSSDALILEANHEVNVLRAGPYPYELQQRILSDHGHLSNDSAGELIARLLDERKESGEEDPPYVMLAHVSQNNNTPEMAYLTVKNILFDDDYYIDRDVRIGVAGPDEMTPEIEL